MALIRRLDANEASTHGVALRHSTLLTLPVVIVSTWLFAWWIVAIRHYEDYQVVVLLGGALPCIAACVTLHWFLYHRRLHHTPSRQYILRTVLLSLVLAWPMLILTGLLISSITVPMVDQSTPTISIFWAMLIGCWVMLTISRIVISCFAKSIAVFLNRLAALRSV